MKLEIIGFNIESCIGAQDAGADRIELCAGPGEGGTTPSYAFIKLARKYLKIDLYAMIRPRGGDFLYSDEDFEIMKQDVVICKEAGCDGIVTGILTAEGKVDKKRCKELLALAYPLEATFHRAFDRVKDPFEALEDIIELGFERILTSGLQPKAAESIPLLSELIKKSGGRIIVMPGSGVNSENIISIAENTGATEFHSSATFSKEGKMNYVNTEMKESLAYVTVNKEAVKNMRSLLDKYQNDTNATT